MQASEAAQDLPARTGLSLPRHVAIIMDGNNRWLKQRGGRGLAGHRAGAEAARTVIRLCAERGIACLTLFAFSSENWQRPVQEVNGLMSLFSRFLEEKAIRQLHERGICLRFIGNRTRFPPQLQKRMQKAERLTAENKGLCVIVAADYGGRWDITEAARQLAMQVQQGILQPEEISEELMDSHVALAGLPAPDLCIRTGGERRISNFLLWQFAYTELYFTGTYWPDFGEAELERALADFASRQRRYGKVSEQVEHEQRERDI